ncbi:hypothetical protein B0J11DRAFT_579445 [Dendryphion nanum]|uniref:DUF7587 domain-containing protein n=1 Tax=Dendryphion nanum TaxID=256645 RepID=A0A9P9DXS5_9PLEO|nr:hypothetical protein B0J11DRAFT_579445 [Dendryphion nanum]
MDFSRWRFSGGTDNTQVLTYVPAQEPLRDSVREETVKVEDEAFESVFQQGLPFHATSIKSDPDESESSQSLINQLVSASATTPVNSSFSETPIKVIEHAFSTPNERLSSATASTPSDNVALNGIDTPCPLPHNISNNIGPSIPIVDIARGKSIHRPSWLKSAPDSKKRKRESQQQKEGTALSFLSLKDLKSIEFEPIHKWSSDDRELLCIIYRWFDSSDATDIPKLFNYITAYSLPLKRIQAQFKNHICLYGSAIPEFDRVFKKTSFEDPEGNFSAIRHIIMAQASEMNLELISRKKDMEFTSEKAAYAKSDRTRAAYKSKVRRASQTNVSEQASSNSSSSSSLPLLNLGGRPLTINLSLSDSIVDSENQSPTTNHHLAFRVWDANSKTKYTETGFISGLLSAWNGPLPEPISPTDPSNAFMILSNSHLSVLGNDTGSCFVSTTTSLIQALTYASSMNDPRIAIINLDHQSLKTPNKKHHAASILSWLKSNGQANWARYKGTAEYLVWGNIEQAAILRHFPISELLHLAATDILCFESIQPILRFDENGVLIPRKKPRTRVVAQMLKEKQLLLDSDTANTMGKLAGKFGLGDSTLSHIKEFVKVIIDGWSISAQAINYNMMNVLAMKFTIAMGPRKSTYDIQEIMKAFIEGIEIGTRNIEIFSGSGHRRYKHRSTL